MKPSRSIASWLAFGLGLPLSCLLLTLLLSLSYTYEALSIVRARGVFASAEDGMRDLIARGYVHPDKVQIVRAGTNSFDGSQPHVWYVIACVQGGTRIDGSPVGNPRHNYDQPGTFFLDTRDGWVHVPEGMFPEVLGFWMKFYGLAGPGSSTPTHDFGDPPQADCPS